MEQFLQTLWEASVQGSVIILAVLLLRLFLKKSSWLVCLLWLLALLRLALPVQIESKLSLQPEVQPLFTQQTEPSFEDTFQQAPDNIVIPDAIPEELPEDVTVYYYDTLVTEVEVHVVDYGAIAAGVWLAGACGMGLYCLVSYLRLKRRVGEAVLIEPGVYESAKLDTAFVLGYFRPRVYLPTGLEGSVRKLIVAHERAHIARLDHWYKLLGFAVLALHWFNPLVWLCNFLLCRDIESACDAHVVRGMDVDQRKAYSAALLSCNARSSALRACPVAFAEDNVKKRIVNVLRYKKPGFWLTVAGIVAVIFVAVCLWTSPKAEGSAPDGEAAEMLALCRRAVEDFQAKESSCVTEKQSYLADGIQMSYRYSTFWYHGDEWFHDHYDSWPRAYLQKDGKQYVRSNADMLHSWDTRCLEWTPLDSLDDVDYFHVWLKELIWDDRQLIYQESGIYEEQGEKILAVTVAVTDSNAEAEETTLTFRIRESDGSLVSVMKMRYGKDSQGQPTTVSSLVTVNDLDAQQIAQTIDSYYAEVLSQDQEREAMFQRCLETQTRIYNAASNGTALHIRGSAKALWMQEGYDLELYYSQGKTYMRQAFANTGRTKEYLLSPEDNAFYSREYVTNKFEGTNSGWERTKGKTLQSFVQEIDPAMLEDAEIQLITASEWSGMRFIIQVDEKTTWRLVYQFHEDGSVTVERDIDDGTFPREGPATMTILLTSANEIINTIDFKLNEASQEAGQREPA